MLREREKEKNYALHIIKSRFDYKVKKKLKKIKQKSDEKTKKRYYLSTLTTVTDNTKILTRKKFALEKNVHKHFGKISVFSDISVKFRFLQTFL